MFSRPKGDKQRKRQTDATGNRPKHNLAQLGLLDMSNLGLDGMETNEDDDDADLEAELLALTGGKRSPKVKKVRKAVDPEHLDKMVSECMTEDYEDEVVDENDPELLAELSALASRSDDELEETSDSSPNEVPVSNTKPSPVRNEPVIVRPSPFVAGHSVADILKDRINNYLEAEQNASAAGETNRAKRFARGLETLQEMILKLDSGGSINESDIPPPVLVQAGNSKKNSPEETRNTSTIPHNVAFTPAVKDGDDQSTPHSESPTILERQKAYKMAALNAKREGNKELAILLMKTAKQIEPMLEGANEGQPVDMSSLPPPPDVLISQLKASIQNTPKVPEVENKNASSETSDVPQEAAPQEPPLPTVPQPTAVPTPATVVEALEQRLSKYTEQRDKAKAENNARKERMNQRIMKQYQEAIRNHKLGRFVNFDELPAPPGYPPIPVGGGSGGSSAPPAPTSAPPAISPATSAPPAAPVPAAPVPNPSAAPAQEPKPAVNQEGRPNPPPSTKPQAPPVPKANVRQAPKSRVERQQSVLKRRQDQFKEAALEAKKKGEVEQAKEYLRNYKGLDQLIQASMGGLPVDMNTVPIPPQETLGCEDTSVDFEVVDKDDCIVSPPSTDTDTHLAFSKLEEDLVAQIKMCAHTREHFKALGDVASANRFEQLILHTKKDLDAVRVAFKRGDHPPRFHYENRSFTVIKCNTDLNDSDCEVTVLRGINFNASNPSDVDSYVKVEFPYPSDSPPQERTPVVKDTNNPEFNHKVVFSIDRKARALSRVFKRHGVKCQVIFKGGWFHRDSLFGSVKVPLVDLETKCIIHESFDLVDEKKKMVGGKLEVKIRVRNPILSKQLEKVTEKWVVIDGF